MMRHVPMRMRFRAAFSSTQAKLGLPFLAAGIISFYVLSLLVDWNALKFSDQKDISITEGHITGYRSTSVSVNKRRVIAVHFRYRIPGDEMTRKGVSYHTGLYHGSRTNLAVEYLTEEPEIARIKGMRSGIMSPIFLFLFSPLLLVGVGFTIYGLRRGLRILRLLDRGEITRGRFVTEFPTRTRINRRRIYACTFDYQVNGTNHTLTERTNVPERIRGEKERKILFHPDRPEQALLFDLLPPSIQQFLQQET